MAEMLKINSTLLTLDLRGNNFCSNKLFLFAPLLLTILLDNQIDNSGVEAFVEALKINSTITHINLNGNPVDYCALRSLKVALKKNTTNSKEVQQQSKKRTK